MNWISRFTVRIGSALALLCLLQALPARADAPQAYLLGNQSVTLSHLSHTFGGAAVGVGDPGFRALLRAAGALLTWQPGERYVLITTAQPQVISFAVGDRRYDVGPLAAQASFAPYVQGSEVYLPLDEVLRALYLAPKRDGNTTVLQPQLASLDVVGSGNGVSLVAHGGAPLVPHILTDSADRVVYEFDGVGSTLDRSRTVNAGGVRTITVATAGTVRDPKTIVTVLLAPNSYHTMERTQGDHDFQVSFSGSALAQPAMPTQLVTPAPAPATPTPMASAQAPESTLAAVSAVDVAQSADGTTVTVAVSGNASYEWHRLRDPDNRFWIDIKGAQLQMPAREQAEPDPLISVRVRQNDAATVRIALSLTGQKPLTVSPGANGLTIAIGKDEVADAPRSGEGSVGSVVSVSEAQTLVTPAPLGAPGTDDQWKFGPRSNYVPTNPRLIILDPGHGGSDRGAIRNGVSEADLALDMAKRVREILIARGWQVQMTRSTDVDVYAPNDSAHQELQARVDVANNAGARVLVSIHVNSFINSGPHGTTTYYSKPVDVAFAQTMEHLLAANLGTKDDGIVKSHLYMTLHSYMPAVLIETAFLSNPDDYERLVSAEWRQRVAQAIADGIDQYTQANPVTGAGQ